MGSRRGYPTAEFYDERQRDFYGGANRSHRDYDEMDVELKRPRSEFGTRRSQPDFLRDDYGRTAAGPLVVSDRRTVVEDDYGRPPPKPRKEVERDEYIIRDKKSERGSHRDDREEIIFRDKKSERGAPREEEIIFRDKKSERGAPREEEIIFRDKKSERGAPREEEIIFRDRKSERGPPREERDEIIFRDREERRPPPRPRDVERDEVIVREREERHRSRPPPQFERDDVDITIKHREQSRPKAREVEREEIYRRPPPPPTDREEIIYKHEEREERPKPRSFDREEIVFRRGEGARSRPPPTEVDREEIRIKRSSPPGRPREVEREEIHYRRTESEGPPPPRERRPPPKGDLVAREKEEFVIRRRPPPSPPPREEKQEIIIRRKERSPSLSPSPSPPPPPPPPEPIVRPPIVQEIITHHRHIDHGVERVRSPSPPPPPPSPPPPKEETLEISIHNRSGGKSYDEDIIFEREIRDKKKNDHVMEITRRRSLSPPKRKPRDEFDMDAEAEYYNRKAAERAYMGEAHNGATKDWAIVDVPPGTNRVRMDGIGGGHQEITWQRYNGVRRSKFITDDREYATDFGALAPLPPALPPPPPKPKPADMWTEITKDLVLKEAIDTMGYDYEETDFFFYVMDYLRYEDVLQLVEISDDIRRERRQRIREIEYERSELDRKSRSRPRPAEYDYYEREVVYERDDRRGRYR